MVINIYYKVKNEYIHTIFKLNINKYIFYLLIYFFAFIIGVKIRKKYYKKNQLILLCISEIIKIDIINNFFYILEVSCVKFFSICLMYVFNPQLHYRHLSRKIVLIRTGRDLGRHEIKGGGGYD